MCQRKILVVLVVFGTDTERRVEDLLKHLKSSVLIKLC